MADESPPGNPDTTIADRPPETAGNGIYDPWQYDDRPVYQRVLQRSETPLIIIGAGLIIGVLLFIGFMPRNGEDAMVKRLSLLEEKLGRLEESVSKMTRQGDVVARFEKRLTVAELSADRFADRFDSVEGAVSRRVERIARDLARLEKQRASHDENATTSRPDDSRVRAKSHPAYHVVRAGENLYRIAKRYNLTMDALCRLNSLPANGTIHPGQKLMVATSNGAAR